MPAQTTPSSQGSVGSLGKDCALVVCSLFRSDTFVVGALWNGSLVWMPNSFLQVLSECERTIREEWLDIAPIDDVPTSLRMKPPGPILSQLFEALNKKENTR